MFRFLRSSSIALALIAITLLAACGANNSQGGQLAKAQVFTIANAGTEELATLDPATVTDLNSAAAVNMLFAGLVSLDAQTLSVKADLAQQLPTTQNGGITNNGLTYTFKIRSDAKFSNGDPIDAHALAYSIDRSLNPKVNAPYATFYLGAIKGAADRNAGKIPTIIGTDSNAGLVVVDPTTLQINLSQPIAYFLDALTYETSFAVDPNEAAANPSSSSFTPTWTDHPVTSGPFMLDSWQHKVEATFVPNPNWYGKKLTLTKVIMPFVKDTGTAYTSYKAKQFDADAFGGNIVTSDNFPDAQALPNHQLVAGPELTINYISTNWKVAPFDNPHVRKAFAMAVDRKTIADQTLKGSVIATDHIVPEGMPGYFPGLQGVPFNPQGAKAELAQAFPDVSKMPKITLTYNTGTPDNAAVARQMQSDFQTYLGVSIQLNGETFNQEVSDIQTFKNQFYMIQWIADYPDAQDWLSGQFTTTSQNNDQNFTDPNFDTLAAKADVDQDPTDRLNLYHQMEELAVDKQAWIPFDQPKNTYLVEPWVKGYVLDAGGLTPDDVWANVQILQH
jgi:oligopeptide transport system substrate-binding protein